jgi:hypothetical protein
MQDCYGCLVSPVTTQGISAYTGKHDSKTSLCPQQVLLMAVQRYRVAFRSAVML